jgi:uncharacterized surface protein with fasciclin (FAS1) repeats
MKNRIIVLFSLFLMVIFDACKKEEAAVALPTFSEYMASNNNLSIFNAAIDKAGLGDFKNGNGPFTWLVPNNDAMAAIGVTLDSVNRMPQGIASYFVTYHLINSKFATFEMVADNSFAKGTQQGGSVYIGRNGNSFFVNGSKIINPDAATSGGLVHTINRVNIPPQLVGNIQSILNRTGQHSLFIAALNKAGKWTQFATTTTFSVLAPTDIAMTNAGLTAAAIAAAPTSKVDSIVRYHYFNSVRLFSNDFGTKETPQTALGAGRTISSLENGIKLKGKTNNSPVLITQNDLLGTNGVVHIIDGVLKF